MVKKSRIPKDNNPGYDLSNAEQRFLSVEPVVDARATAYISGMIGMYEDNGFVWGDHVPRKWIMHNIRQGIFHRQNILAACPRCSIKRKAGEGVGACPDCVYKGCEVEIQMTALLFMDEARRRPIVDRDLRIWCAMHRAERTAWIQDLFIENGMPFKHALSNDPVLQRLELYEADADQIEESGGDVLAQFADNVRLKAACLKHALISGKAKSRVKKIDTEFIQVLITESNTPTTPGNVATAWEKMVKGKTPNIDDPLLGYGSRTPWIEPTYKCCKLMCGAEHPDVLEQLSEMERKAQEQLRSRG